MARIVVVPGLAVRSYALPAARRAVGAGHTVTVLRGVGWRGAPTDPERYGRVLASDLDGRRQTVDVLVGLSVGTQAAAAAAARSRRIGNLVLVSPTVDPALRTLPRLLRAWWAGNRGHGEPGFTEQVPDWRRAGVSRIVRGFAATLEVEPLERVLPRVAAAVTVVHAGHDDLGSEAWAAELAAGAAGRSVVLPDAPHSWPVADPEGFVRLLGDVLGRSSS